MGKNVDTDKALTLNKNDNICQICNEQFKYDDCITQYREERVHFDCNEKLKKQASKNLWWFWVLDILAIVAVVLAIVLKVGVGSYVY